MRIYNDEKEMFLQSVICNQCGGTITVVNGMIKEGCLEGTQRFGYFSKKDGQEHHFDLCEQCYDEMVEHFQIPIQIREINELL